MSDQVSTSTPGKIRAALTTMGQRAIVRGVLGELSDVARYMNLADPAKVDIEEVKRWVEQLESWDS